jgi:hypothetical protein
MTFFSRKPLVPIRQPNPDAVHAASEAAAREGIADLSTDLSGPALICLLIDLVKDRPDVNVDGLRVASRTLDRHADEVERG